MVGIGSGYSVSNIGGVGVVGVNSVINVGVVSVSGIVSIVSSKTDHYRDGSSVLLARTGTVTCPYTILSRYFHLASLNCNSSDFVFHSLVYN